MKTIYKYTLDANNTVLEMPMGAKVLSVASQGDDLCLWAKVDTEDPIEQRTFEVYGTGHPMPDDDEHLQFLGTALMHGGSLVWHVFQNKHFEI